MRVSRTIRYFGAVMVLAWAAAGCDIAVDGHGGMNLEFASGRAQDEWTRTYQVQPGARFELVNVNGKIDAQPADGTTLEVRAERIARAGSDESAKEFLGRVEMREEAGADKVRVEVRAPRVSMGGAEVRWTIRVPKGVHVDLRTVNGGVTLTGLDGEVRASATNGGIKGRHLSARSLDASTTNGGVDIELATAPTDGTFSLECVNGGVQLALPGESRAEVSARVMNGGINVSGLDLTVEGEQNRRRLNGRLNGGGARISLETTNGGIRISRLSSNQAS